MNQHAPTVRSPATYQDVLDAPENMVAELIEGALHLRPRPAPRHARASSSLGVRIGGPFDSGPNGPGGWWILDEPELHFADDVLVPDLAGWRRGDWNSDDEVRTPPFDAVAFSLADLWPLDRPLGLEESPQHLFVGDR